MTDNDTKVIYPGFDTNRYSFWWQDANFKPKYVTRIEMSEMIGKSTQIINKAIHERNAPHRKIKNMVEIPVQPFLLHYMAYLSGMTADDYKELLIEEAKREGYFRNGQPNVQPYDNRLAELEEENRKLRAQIAALEGV